MHAFSPGRRQDASATIQGFSYQIQMTLRRWIDLGHDEHLVLECGEDIDRICASSNPEDARREMEQVKTRTRSLTLRSPEIGTALANFARHIHSNPDQDLWLRFTTTAAVGREQNTGLPGATKGIEEWNRLATIPGSASKQELECLAQIISGLTRPPKCDREAWGLLQDIVAGVGVMAFEEFVARVEWSCGQTGPQDLRDELIADIAALENFPPSDTSAIQRYDQLRVRLLDLLSIKGPKVLSRDTLVAALAEPTLTQTERDRLSVLEHKTAQHADTLAAMQLPSRLPAILFGSAIVKELEGIHSSLSLPSPPALVRRLASRKQTVAHIAQRISSGPIVIFGSYGTGKSHLAKLLADHIGGVAVGVSARGVPEQSCAHALELLAGSRDLWLKIEGASGPQVVLIDDLPPVHTHSRLELALRLILQVANQSRAIVIVTTSRRLESRTIEETDISLQQIEVPFFSDEEATELLVAHDVPEPLRRCRTVQVLNATCRGHPLLLAALCRYLRQFKEEPKEAFLSVIRDQAYRQPLDLETTRQVLETVEAENCRQLLYRLASIPIPLSAEEISSIGHAEPAISEPGACLARLEGLWVRTTDDNRFEASPVTATLVREVPAEVLERVHRKAASLILCRGPLTQLEFAAALFSLLYAKERNSAAYILVQAHTKLRLELPNFDALGVLEVLPPGGVGAMSPVFELPLRAVQIVTAMRTGADSTPYVESLMKLAEIRDPHSVIGAALAGTTLLCSYEGITGALAILGARYLEELRAFALPKELQEIHQLLPHDLHVALAVGSVKTWDDLDALVQFLSELPLERRRAILQATEVRAFLGIAVLGRVFLDTEVDPIAVDPIAIERLCRIEAACQVVEGLDLVRAHAVSGRLIIYGEYENSISRVLNEGRAALDLCREDTASRAVIDAAMGQQLTLKGRTEEGYVLLRSALGAPKSFSYLEGLRLFGYLLEAAWDSDGDTREVADGLSALLQSGGEESPAIRSHCHALLGIARWRDGSHVESAEHFERSVEALLDVTEMDRQRQLGAANGYAITYYAALAESGVPPERTADVGPFEEPHPRLFAEGNRKVGASWCEKQGPVTLRLTLGRLLIAVGQQGAGLEWIKAAYEGAIQIGLPLETSVSATALLSASCESLDWASALETAMIAGRALVYNQKARAGGIDARVLAGAFNPLGIEDSSEDRVAAESLGLSMLTRGVALTLGPLGMRDQSCFNEQVSRLGKEVEATLALREKRESWQGVADILELCAKDELGVGEIRAGIAAADTDARYLAHGLLCFRSDTLLDQAAASQAGILCDLSNDPVFRRAFEKYVVAVMDYWENMIVQRRFDFASPRTVDSAFLASHSFCGLPRVKVMLEAVFDSLKMRGTEQLRAWLRS